MRFFWITSFGFDSKGKSYPRRINCYGRDIWLERSDGDNFVSFSLGNRYYWLVRRGGKWRLLDY